MNSPKKRICELINCFDRLNITCKEYSCYVGIGRVLYYSPRYIHNIYTKSYLERFML